MKIEALIKTMQFPNFLTATALGQEMKIKCRRAIR
jgi:hypothetical protein